MYSTGNYIQYLVRTYKGKNLKKHTHVTESLCCTPETNTTLQISDTSIFKKVINAAIPQETSFIHISEKLGKCYLKRGLPWWLSGKESTCNAGVSSSIPELGRSPRRGYDNLFQYSCLEIIWIEEPGGLQSIHRVIKSQTQLSYWALILKEH